MFGGVCKIGTLKTLMKYVMGAVTQIKTSLIFEKEGGPYAIKISLMHTTV